jgi:hypothetical protein
MPLGHSLQPSKPGLAKPSRDVLPRLDRKEGKVASRRNVGKWAGNRAPRSPLPTAPGYLINEDKNQKLAAVRSSSKLINMGVSREWPAVSGRPALG